MHRLHAVPDPPHRPGCLPPAGHRLGDGGMILKLTYPDRFERLSILLYLDLGWSGMLIYGRVIVSLSPAILWLLAVGACCIRQACSSTSGSGCASTMPCGTPSCLWRRFATSALSSRSSPDRPRGAPLFSQVARPRGHKSVA